jgi:hypothetical protein
MPEAPQVLDRSAQTVACGAEKIARGAARCASQAIYRGAQAVARGAARCASQALSCGAQAVAQGAARCASQLLDRSAKAAARRGAALSQQEKNNSACVKRNRLNITGFICTVVRWLSRRCTFGEFESLAVASRRRKNMFNTNFVKYPC